MKASDEMGHYTFECIGIKSNADRPITVYKVFLTRLTARVITMQNIAMR